MDEMDIRLSRRGARGGDKLVGARLVRFALGSVEIDRREEHATRFMVERPADLRRKVAITVDPHLDALADHQRLLDLEAKTVLADVGNDPRQFAPIGIDARAKVRGDARRALDLTGFMPSLTLLLNFGQLTRAGQGEQPQRVIVVAADEAR